MMMTLDGECRLADVPRELYERLTRELTVLNPAWQTALRLGRPTYGIKKHLLLYRVENSELILPRGMAMQVWARKPGRREQRLHPHLRAGGVCALRYPPAGLSGTSGTGGVG